MRVVRLHGPGDLRLEEAPVPRPGPGEVAIDVDAVGICASDLHYYLHGEIGGLTVEGGLILGHEFAGTIAEVGQGTGNSAAVRAAAGSEMADRDVTGSTSARIADAAPASPPGRPAGQPEAQQAILQVGQRVCAEPVRPCGACRECARGDYHLCRTLRFFGTPPTDGALCDRVICPAEWVFPLPDALTTPEGAMIEPLAVGVYAAELAGLRGGETAAVVGCGAIGLSALQALLVMGAAAVHVEDPIAGRKGLAIELGAERESPAPHAADVVAECAGTPEALARGVELARPGGAVLVVGIPDEDAIVFSASAARRKGLTLRFVRRYRHCFPRAVEWTAGGRVRVAPFLTHRFPLERAREAFDLAASRADGVIRVWIDLTQGRVS